ncbi:MAG: hypothetical protein WDW36_010307 [Sanguina aurantia]
MTGPMAASGSSRHRIKGRTASVIRFFFISNAFMITWVLITSELGYYSKLFGPQVLLQLNVAFYLPSIPVLIISGQLEQALQARLGPASSMMLRLNFGLGGCLAVCAAFPFLPETLTVLMGVVVLLGTLSAVAFSTAYQLVSNFRAADCISLGIGGAGSGPVVLLIQLLLRVGPRPARWQWVAMFEVAAGMAMLGLLSSLSLFTQYWSLLGCSSARQSTAPAESEEQAAGLAEREPLLLGVVATAKPAWGGQQRRRSRRRLPRHAGWQRRGRAVTLDLAAAVGFRAGGGEHPQAPLTFDTTAPPISLPPTTSRLSHVTRVRALHRLFFDTVGAANTHARTSRPAPALPRPPTGLDTMSDAWGARNIPILTRSRTSLGRRSLGGVSRPSPTSGFLGFTPPRAALNATPRPTSAQFGARTPDAGPATPGRQRRAPGQNWFGGSSQRAMRPTPEQHYVSTMGFDGQQVQQQHGGGSHPHQHQQQQQYSQPQQQQQQQQQQRRDRLDFSAEGSDGTRPAGRLSNLNSPALALNERAAPSPTRRSGGASGAAVSLQHHHHAAGVMRQSASNSSLAGSSRDLSGDSGGSGGGVGCGGVSSAAHTPALAAAWTSPFQSQADLQTAEHPHRLSSPQSCATPHSTAHGLKAPTISAAGAEAHGCHHAAGVGADGLSCLGAVEGEEHAGGSAADDTPFTLGEETWLVVQGTWQILFGFFSSVALLYLVFPFFTYIPSSGLLGESLPRVLFFVRIFADLLGRFLPRKKLFMTSSPSLILTLAVVEVAAVALFFGYLRAPAQMHNDLLSVGIVAFIWLQGGYINTTSNLLAPNLVHPQLCGRASAVMALTFQVAHFAGLLLAALLTFLLYGDLLNR